jgi:hypothetical protein
LLIEWPEGEAAPTKYWLSTLDKGISFRHLVDIAKMRWRIERDYQELKQEIGLGHYEGRGWPGFHHHGTLCIAAYGFLISERETIPPSGPRSSGRLTKPAVPGGYRPRGAPDPASASRPQLDRNAPSEIGRRHRPNSATLPMLLCAPLNAKYASYFYDAVKLEHFPIRLNRHGRACPGHPGLDYRAKDEDARPKAGHDGRESV